MAKVDWTKSCDRRSVAAKLVESVYLLEHDRERNRKGKEAQAPPLWKAFNFELYMKLIDDDDSSIFGAIYQLCSTSTSASTSTSTTAPRYVIAFRGTIAIGHASKRDCELNRKLMPNKLHQTSRFVKAIQAVRHVVQTFGSENVWLAGHSQGAAIALLVGKDMAAPWEMVEVEQEGVEAILLDSFVFNPPFPSFPIERMIKSRGGKFALRAAGTVIKAGLALTMEDRGRFAALAPWRPHLFLNPKDPVCAEYIGYFEHNKRMKDMGKGKMATLAAQHSVVGAVLNALGKEWREPLHRIPSAHVTVNCDSSCLEAHSIRQWFRPDLETETYTYALIDP